MVILHSPLVSPRGNRHGAFNFHDLISRGPRSISHSDLALDACAPCNDTIAEVLGPDDGKHVRLNVLMRLQSSVKTFLPGFGNGWLKYCGLVKFWGGQRILLRVVLGT